MLPHNNPPPLQRETQLNRYKRAKKTRGQTFPRYFELVRMAYTGAFFIVWMISIFICLYYLPLIQRCIIGAKRDAIVTLGFMPYVGYILFGSVWLFILIGAIFNFLEKVLTPRVYTYSLLYTLTDARHEPILSRSRYISQFTEEYDIDALAASDPLRNKTAILIFCITSILVLFGMFDYKIINSTGVAKRWWILGTEQYEIRWDDVSAASLSASVTSQYGRNFQPRFRIISRTGTIYTLWDNYGLGQLTEEDVAKILPYLSHNRIVIHVEPLSSEVCEVIGKEYKHDMRGILRLFDSASSEGVRSCPNLHLSR